MKFNMQEMLEKAQKMQQEMERIKRQVAELTVTEESGGGMVKVTMSGNYNINKITISPEIVNPDDIEMLEDLVVAAVNKASKAAQDLVANEMNKVSSFLPEIPGLNLELISYLKYNRNFE